LKNEEKGKGRAWNLDLEQSGLYNDKFTRGGIHMGTRGGFINNSLMEYIDELLGGIRRGRWWNI
jgi:hypothetical protein